MNRLRAQLKLDRSGFRLDADLDVPLDGVTVVFGPSGCGKTTLLRCIAGLEQAQGEIRIGDEIWQGKSTCLPPHQRHAGFVFQEARLFSHRSVRANLLYGYDRTPQSERRIHPDPVIDLLQLGPLLERRPGGLSGGEQQRVAIGRALLANPRVLLMDEPLANLDQARKQEILPFLQELRRELKIPVLYVTHSMEEVLQLVDTLVMLENGCVRASGPANEILTGIGKDGFTAGALAGTLLETEVLDHEPEFGLTRLRFHDHVLHVPHQDAAPGTRLRLHLLARDVSLVLEPETLRTSVLNILRGTVMQIVESESEPQWVQVLVDVGEPVVAAITRKSWKNLGLEPGQSVEAHVKALRLVR